MRRHLSRLSLPQRALAWLLLALLPLAQAVAAGHAVSHLATGGQGSQEQGSQEDRQALHAAHCQLCISAATVAAGALPATLPTLAPPPLRQAAPAMAVAHAWAPPFAAAYDSRAPPKFTH